MHNYIVPTDNRSVTDTIIRVARQNWHNMIHGKMMFCSLNCSIVEPRIIFIFTLFHLETSILVGSISTRGNRDYQWNRCGIRQKSHVQIRPTSAFVLASSSAVCKMASIFACWSKVWGTVVFTICSRLYWARKISSYQEHTISTESWQQ